MKKIVNFLNKQIEKPARYKEFKINLNLDEDLDLPYLIFIEKLNNEIKEQLDDLNIADYNGEVMVKVFTKLPRIELIPLKDLIMSTVANYFIETTKVFKTERILGITLFKDFEKIELPLVTLMDLLNYPLIQEAFNIGLYDDQNLLYKSLVNW